MALKEEHAGVELAALEDVLLRLDELQIVLGTAVGGTLGAIRASLIEALAARDRGDMPAAVAGIGKAMDGLSSLADKLDPDEGAMMRMVAGSFRNALLRGDYANAKQTADVMMQKSGAVERKKKT
jgi:hypothetical protein